MLSLDLFTQHHVRCGEAIILLDLVTDSYLCRYEGAPPAVIADTPPREPRWHDAPAADDRLRPGDIGRFLRAQLSAWFAAWGRSLQSLLIHAAELERPTTIAAPAELAVLAARFERMSLYLPARPSCLRHALALLHYLRLHGETADWIIAVQLFPFRAHCWLAVDDMLLGERAHLIEDYRPIFTLRRPRG